MVARLPAHVPALHLCYCMCVPCVCAIPLSGTSACAQQRGPGGWAAQWMVFENSVNISATSLTSTSWGSECCV